MSRILNIGWQGQKVIHALRFSRVDPKITIHHPKQWQKPHTGKHGRRSSWGLPLCQGGELTGVINERWTPERPAETKLTGFTLCLWFLLSRSLLNFLPLLHFSFLSASFSFPLVRYLSILSLLTVGLKTQTNLFLKNSRKGERFNR